MGRLTATPELKTTQNGKKVCSFTLAVDGRGKDAAADFINFSAWEKQAEFITKYFVKGARMLVNGSLHNRSYTDKDGNKRWTSEILVNEAAFCESKSGGNSQAQNSAPAQKAQKSEKPEVTDAEVDGDLPF